uniref:Uncharacterized protein n=1 Tax=Rhodnius prolixus TaxID=13249 RepID=T1HFA0_RHOPR
MGPRIVGSKAKIEQRYLQRVFVFAALLFAIIAAPLCFQPKRIKESLLQLILMKKRMQNLPSHIKIQKSALSAVLVSNVYFLFTLLEDNMSWENGYPITGRDEGYLCESLSVGWPRRCDSAATTPGSANARNRKDRPKNGGFLVFEMLEQGIGPCISVAVTGEVWFTGVQFEVETGNNHFLDSANSCERFKITNVWSCESLVLVQRS